MKSQRLLQQVIGCTLVVFFLAACGAPQAPAVPTSTASPSVGTGQATFTDPYAYCTAVGNMDTPDARYTGPKTPDLSSTLFKQG